ncbi:MAG: hypothetical protein NVSMB13_01790 [Mycobacteriales bacterium]
MRPLAALTLPLPTLQALYLTVVPHGGQHVARRNAWGAMASDNARMRARREAAAAIEAAESRASAEKLALSR